MPLSSVALPWELRSHLLAEVCLKGVHLLFKLLTIKLAAKEHFSQADTLLPPTDSDTMSQIGPGGPQKFTLPVNVDFPRHGSRFPDYASESNFGGYSIGKIDFSDPSQRTSDSAAAKSL